MFQFYEKMFPGHSLSVDKFHAFVGTKNRDGSPNPETAPALKRIKNYGEMKKAEALRKYEESIALTPAGLQRRWEREQQRLQIDPNVP